MGHTQLLGCSLLSKGVRPGVFQMATPLHQVAALEDSWPILLMQTQGVHW